MIVTNDDHPLQPTADVVGCYDIRSAVLVVHRAPAFFISRSSHQSEDLIPDQPSRFVTALAVPKAKATSRVTILYIYYLFV